MHNNTTENYVNGQTYPQNKKAAVKNTVAVILSYATNYSL